MPKLPRPPRTTDRDAPPEPTMPTPGPVDNPEPHTNERPLRLTRRRVLMGDILRGVTVKPTTASSAARRLRAMERAETSRQLLTGGVSEGEQRGFGANADDPALIEAEKNAGEGEDPAP